MEVYSDPPSENATQRLMPATPGRTPLVDVRNLTHTRFEHHMTPKRLGDGFQSRRSKLLGAPTLSSSPTESVKKDLPSSGEPTMLSRLHHLEDLDVGAEIVLDGSEESLDADPALPIDFSDADRADLNSEQSHQVLAKTTIAKNPLFGDHTYLTSRLGDGAEHQQGIHALNAIDRCVGPDTGFTTIVSAADKCFGPDVCLNISETDEQLEMDVPPHVLTVTEQCVGTEVSSHVGDSMITENAITSDCSVLAVPDCLSQETMTETDAIDTSSSMTPFKLGKHGSRLTAEEVRRQHPRVVANQLDTVMLSNQRLEKQAKSSEREKSLLKSALKESKLALQGRDTKIAELETFLGENQQKLSQQENALLEERMKCWNAEETMQSSKSDLEKKCQDLERLHHEAELSYAEELERVHIEAEKNSYKKQFESAQQKIRELQTAEQEYVQIANEVEKAHALQDHLRKAMTQLKATASGLARDKVQLQIENESLKKRCMSKEVDQDVLRFINQELLSDNENMKELVSRSEQCVTELEGSLKAASAAISHLQEQLAHRLADNAALTKAKEEMRRDKAMMIIQLSEQQDSENVALQALEEAEKELSKTEEALAKEKAILAAGREMHERMEMDYEEKLLKLEMEIQHLEELLDKCESKRDAQEQELFECQEELYTLQDKKAVFEATTLDVDSGIIAMQDLQEQMEALFSTLNRKIDHSRSKSQSTKVNSSTPKNKKHSRRSFVSQVLSAVKISEMNSTSYKYTHDFSMDSSYSSRPNRQQSNVEFGARSVESGAAAAALLSPHSQSFCGMASNRKDLAVAPAPSSCKSVSFTEPPGSRRALFCNSVTEVKAPAKKQLSVSSNPVLVPTVEEDDGHSTTPGFARIKSIPLTTAVARARDTEVADGAERSGKSCEKSVSENLLSVNLSPLSEKVQVLAQLLRQIIKAVQLVERESYLSIRDGQDELHFVKEQLKQENETKQELQLELEKKSESLDVINSRQKELQNRVSEMTKSLLNFHDQSLQISRLEEEKRDMKLKIADLEGQCSLLSDHLEAVVKKLDAAMSGHAGYDGTSGQEVLALKREKHELVMKLFAERAQHRDLGDKAFRRMKVLEGNWKKAEDEVKRLDDLIEHVREGCVSSQAQSTHPLILDIVRLIDGKLPSLDRGNQA